METFFTIELLDGHKNNISGLTGAGKDSIRTKWLDMIHTNNGIFQAVTRHALTLWSPFGYRCKMITIGLNVMSEKGYTPWILN